MTTLRQMVRGVRLAARGAGAPVFFAGNVWRAGFVRFARHARPAAWPTWRAAPLALAAALAGCASPSNHFYTLGGASNAAPVTVANPTRLIEVAPVDVPPEVARNQFVVRVNGTSGNEVRVLEQERWAALPGDEIRRALSVDLTQRLGTIDVYGAPHPENVPTFRVSVNVQRFESWPGSHTLLDAVWSVREPRRNLLMTCRFALREPVGDGYGPLVAGHRRAVDALAQAIASGVQAQERALAANASAWKNHADGARSIACP